MSLIVKSPISELHLCYILGSGYARTLTPRVANSSDSVSSPKLLRGDVDLGNSEWLALSYHIGGACCFRL